MNYVAIAVGIMMLICLGHGYVRGLFRTVVFLGAGVGAMLLSVYVGPHVGTALSQYTKIDEGIQQHIAEEFSIDVHQQATTKNEEMELIEGLPCTEFMKMLLVSNNYDQIYDDWKVEGFYDYVVTCIVKVIMNCLGFVLMEIIIGIGFFILSRSVQFVTEIPIVHGIDKIGGVAVGMLEALALIWSFFIAVSIFSGTSWGISFMDQINQSKMLTFLYENNWLIQGITRGLGI